MLLRGLSTTVAAMVGLSAVVWLSTIADAQLTDITQTPNQANAGIQKSLEEQIGAGQGDVMTPDASLFIIQRDPFRAIRRGRQVFQRKFTAAQGAGPAGRAQAEGELTSALGRLLVVAEAYPELRANQSFVALQGELANTEDKIAYALQFFNSAVQSYNNAVQTLPSNLVAGVAGFRAREFYQASGDERGPVQVRF